MGEVTLGTLGVAFVACAIWLMVRIINRRQRWAKRMAVALALSAIVGYPLSIGPVSVFSPELRIRADDFYRFYYPIYWASYKSELVDDLVFKWYCDDIWHERFVGLGQESFGEDD